MFVLIRLAKIGFLFLFMDFIILTLNEHLFATALVLFVRLITSTRRQRSTFTVFESG